MATEVILMQCVKAGGDRQILHESIREHSMAAGRRVQHCIPLSPPYFFFATSFFHFFFFFSLSFPLSFSDSFSPLFSYSFHLFLFSFPFLYYFFLVSINSNSANSMSSSVSHYHTLSNVFALYVFVYMLGEGGRCRQ